MSRFKSSSDSTTDSMPACRGSAVVMASLGVSIASVGGAASGTKPISASIASCTESLITTRSWLARITFFSSGNSTPSAWR